MEIENQYPIGQFIPIAYNEALMKKWINDIRYLPDDVENVVLNLDEQQYKTPYRQGGWTVKQLIHHLADSHMNGYTRMKLCYIEDTPTIKPYDENAFANLKDVDTVATNVSITLLHALHQRWYGFLQQLTEEDFTKKTVYHPEQKKHLLKNIVNFI